MLLIKQLVLIDPDDEIPVEKNTRKDRKGDEAREIGQQLSLHEWSRRIFLPHLFLTATVPLHFPSFDVDIVQIRAMFNKKKKTHKIRVAPPVYASRDVNLHEMLNEFQYGRSHLAIIYDNIDLPPGK